MPSNGGSGGGCVALAGATLGNSNSAIFPVQWPHPAAAEGDCCLALARAALGNDDNAISPM